MVKENSDLWSYLPVTTATENHACQWLETSFLKSGVNGANSVACATNTNQNSGVSY